MKQWILQCLILGLCASWWVATPAARAGDENVRLRAVMIYASNEPAEKDPRLKGIEGKLRGVLGFKYYQHYGEGSGSAALPGSATLGLGKGHQLDVHVSPADKGKIRAGVSWTKGGSKLISTSYVLNRNGSTVIGGPSHDKGKLMVVLFVK